MIDFMVGFNQTASYAKGQKERKESECFAFLGFLGFEEQ
tara:strand:- start:2524 stop:2640 length:117 start_codon:yes stop_codon:yes gene_type:complete